VGGLDEDISIAGLLAGLGDQAIGNSTLALYRTLKLGAVFRFLVAHSLVALEAHLSDDEAVAKMGHPILREDMAVSLARVP
jgi:hypothetical protein